MSGESHHCRRPPAVSSGLYVSQDGGLTQTGCSGSGSPAGEGSSPRSNTLSRIVSRVAGHKWLGRISRWNVPYPMVPSTSVPVFAFTSIEVTSSESVPDAKLGRPSLKRVQTHDGGDVKVTVPRYTPIAVPA